MKHSHPERDIEYTILSWLNAQGVFAWKVNTEGWYDEKRGAYRARNNMYAINGVSDIVGILPDGKFLAVEVKTPQRKLCVSEDQKFFLDTINKYEGISCVATCYEDVEKVLLEAGYTFS